nr:peptidoglycan DD-metalloendopeptidase family protein [Parvularcula dongshanensis]
MLVLLLLLSPAFAQDANEAERLREIEQLREEKAKDAEALRARTAAAAEALRQLQANLVRTAESLQEAEAAATAAEVALARTERERAEVAERLAGRRRAVSEVLAALQNLERTRPPALAVSPDDANRAAMAAIALSAVTPELTDEIEALKTDLARIEEIRARAQREQRALAGAEAALTERRRLLEEQLADRERRQAADVTRLRRIEREDAALAAEATTLQGLIEGISRRDEGRPVPAAPSLRPAPTDLPPPEIYAGLPDRFADARERLPLPASGRIVQRFGDTLRGGGRAQELSLVTRGGAVVTAPFGGVVKWAKPYGALGNIVILDVGDGYTLVLIGLGEFTVRRDDRVRPGEPLGYMPPAGGTLRLHLRRAGQVLDPEPWLRPGGG